MPTTALSLDVHLETLHYPVVPTTQQELIQFWRMEWTRTDYDWLEALNGDYSEHLVISTIIARRQGEVVATATIHYHRRNPTVAVLGNVLTRRDVRGVGIGSQVVAAALAEAVAVGCQRCLLGTAKNPRNVYLRHGFDWLNGTVMGRAFRPGEAASPSCVAGQSTHVRAANWGDLPGLSALVAQPLATACLDYARGLYSGRVLPAERCLSNFPVLWYEAIVRGGALAILAGNDEGSVLGFGSVTPQPGAGRRSSALLDFAAHDRYVVHQAELIEHLIDSAEDAGFQRLEAWILSADEEKTAALRAIGFVETARFPNAVQLAGDVAEVVVWDRAV